MKALKNALTFRGALLFLWVTHVSAAIAAAGPGGIFRALLSSGIESSARVAGHLFPDHPGKVLELRKALLALNPRQLSSDPEVVALLKKEVHEL
ncbi:MAG: hypothetical protein ACK5QT_10595, partial [Oligoflexia bacterium]